MIRFIVETVSSKTDINGNRYHFATVTSTKTGKTLNLASVGGDSNAVRLVKSKLDLDWSEIHSTNQTEMIRDWNRMNSFDYRKEALYEHQVDATMLKRLERKDRAKAKAA